jgi:Spy/CpxP family protein refolding chaperone
MKTLKIAVIALVATLAFGSVQAQDKRQAKFEKRMAHMTPEQREKFITKLEKRKEKRTNMTPQEKEIAKTKTKERQERFKAMTPEQRAAVKERRKGHRLEPKNG